MKTNTMMRVASVLLVAVLLSTCAIAGTYAKYVTSASGTDTARVAKWGIKMSNTGKSTFVASYDSENPTVNGLDGSTAADVVAPGTSSSAQYKVTGAPETDYVITFEYAKNSDTATDAFKEVYLGAGTYTYSAKESGNNAAYDAGMTQTVTDTYYPIKYTVKISGSGTIADKDSTAPSNILKETATTDTENTAVKIYTKTYNTLAAALGDLEKVKVTYTHNKECDLIVEISWNWVFENNGSTTTQNDQYDTILGDLIASNDALVTSNTTGNTAADYCTSIAYTLTLTATQID